MQKTNEEYNGWTNYETWNVKLWIDNDQGLQEMVREFERCNQGNPHLYQVQKDDELRDYVWTLFEGDEEIPQLATGPFCDLLGAAWAKVDWKSIREHIAEEIAECSA